MRLGDQGQTIQMQIPPKRNRVPWIYHWTIRGPDRPSQDTGHLGLDNPQKNQGKSVFPRILQLIQAIYRRFQQESQTTIRENKKEMHRQLGVGRQRTTSIWQTKDKTHHSTSSGLLWPLAPTKIETEASKYVCSGILSQQCQDREWRLVAYRSKIMSDAEDDYDIHNKELVAIVRVFHEGKR